MAVEGRLQQSVGVRSRRSTRGFSRPYRPAGQLAFTHSGNERFGGVSLSLYQLGGKTTNTRPPGVPRVTARGQQSVLAPGQQPRVTTIFCFAVPLLQWLPKQPGRLSGPLRNAPSAVMLALRDPATVIIAMQSAKPSLPCVIRTRANSHVRSSNFGRRSRGMRTNRMRDDAYQRKCYKAWPHSSRRESAVVTPQRSPRAVEAHASPPASGPAAANTSIALVARRLNDTLSGAPQRHAGKEAADHLVLIMGAQNIAINKLPYRRSIRRLAFRERSANRAESVY